MGYVDKSDSTMGSFTISNQTWQWTLKLFFQLLDICASKISQQKIRITLVRDLTHEAGRVPVSDHMMGNIKCFHEPTRLDTQHNKQYTL